MSSEIDVLKKQAKIIYEKYNNRLDDYSCGKELAEYICPDIYRYKEEFNKIMDKLKVLDPSNCPSFRL